MRSVEPLTGIDALVVALFPLLGGTEPQSGERGIDRFGNIYQWRPESGGWMLTDPAPRATLDAAHPGWGATADAQAEAG